MCSLCSAQTDAFTERFIYFEVFVSSIMVFEDKVTDEQILKALQECINEAIVPASDVADKLDMSSRRIKERLLLLETKLVCKKIGNVWCFRPK